MNRKVCTPKKTGRSKTAKTADAVGGFAKQNFDNRPFCVAKCFDQWTAKIDAAAVGSFAKQSSEYDAAVEDRFAKQSSDHTKACGCGQSPRF